MRKSETNKECTPRACHEFDRAGDERIIVWHRSLPEMLAFYAKRLGSGLFLDNVSHAEVSLGGNHRKNSYLFLARHKDNNDAHRLEINVGEKNEEKDKIFFKEIMKKIMRTSEN